MKKAQEAAKNAALTGAEYTPEMEQAEQDAIKKVNELQKQLDAAKAEKETKSKPAEEFAKKVKEERQGIMKGMKGEMQKELKQKMKELRTEIKAITTQDEYDAFKAGSFVDFQTYIEE